MFVLITFTRRGIILDDDYSIQLIDDLKDNIIVLGNGAVGKTSLLKMYSDNSF